MSFSDSLATPLPGTHTCSFAASAARLAASTSSTRTADRASSGAASRIVLVDATSLMFRMHFGYGVGSRLTTSQGEDVTIIHGVLSSISNLLAMTPPPTHFAVVFDSHGKTFRQHPTSFRYTECSAADFLVLRARNISRELDQHMLHVHACHCTGTRIAHTLTSRCLH